MRLLFGWPLDAVQFLGQLLRVRRVDEGQVWSRGGTGEKLGFLRRSNDKPKNLFVGVIEHLAQLVGPHHDPTVLGHGQCLSTHSHASGSFQNDIEFLRTNVFVQGVGALGGHAPQTRSHVLASSSLQVIRIRDLHEVGGPPEKVFRLDEMVALDGVHGCGKKSA